MAWIFDTYSMNKGHSVLGVVTGKPLNVGGCSGGSRRPARLAPLHPGSGAEEGAAARRTSPPPCRASATSAASWPSSSPRKAQPWSLSPTLAGGLHNPNGIDVAAAIAHKRETGSLAGLGGAEEITNDELLLLDCDVLAPCALEQVITGDNAAQVKAQIVCEGANGPITPAGGRDPRGQGRARPAGHPRQRGRRVVSYFEWVQGLQEYFWKEPEVNSKLRDIVTRAFNETWHVYEEKQTSMRVAAYGVSVGRVADATVTRGLYPYTPTEFLDHVPQAPSRVTVYHGAGGHLCERALAQVRALRD